MIEKVCYKCLKFENYKSIKYSWIYRVQFCNNIIFIFIGQNDNSLAILKKDGLVWKISIENGDFHIIVADRCCDKIIDGIIATNIIGEIIRIACFSKLGLLLGQYYERL